MYIGKHNDNESRQQRAVEMSVNFKEHSIFISAPWRIGKLQNPETTLYTHGVYSQRLHEPWLCQTKPRFQTWPNCGHWTYSDRRNNRHGNCQNHNKIGSYTHAASSTTGKTRAYHSFDRCAFTGRTLTEVWGEQTGLAGGGYRLMLRPPSSLCCCWRYLSLKTGAVRPNGTYAVTRYR